MGSGLVCLTRGTTAGVLLFEFALYMSIYIIPVCINNDKKMEERQEIIRKQERAHAEWCSDEVVWRAVRQ